MRTFHAYEDSASHIIIDLSRSNVIALYMNYSEPDEKSCAVLDT